MRYGSAVSCDKILPGSSATQQDLSQFYSRKSRDISVNIDSDLIYVTDISKGCNAIVG